VSCWKKGKAKEQKKSVDGSDMRKMTSNPAYGDFGVAEVDEDQRESTPSGVCEKTQMLSAGESDGTSSWAERYVQ
jgi:hypothetical protein